ncbi:ADP compounds hydrolase NudE [Paraglaciecola arctica]|uniref:ADP compounds hydrolase NudE n=1 Tax=Paraglaciecola arctica TaxID=1128911 RepID=UPI0005874E60|nr:ADP compounds hydrolase NudE [Paraglaciecola arctica]|tara:strand:- start:2357 stop:2920 length:564 start_codon:yes stop_codon:yes gene_type:complete
MSNTNNKKSLPQIHGRKVVAKSGLFKIEQVDLEFSNGETRVFERMAGSGRGAVMVVPFINDDEFLLVREYAAGTHSYELGFPKGLIDPGESPEVAANRELKEEIGFGTEVLHPLHIVSMAPAFFDAKMTIFIAENLYPKVLPGDEPEPLEVVKWSIHDIDTLLARDDFVEARCIVALLLAEKWWRKR